MQIWRCFIAGNAPQEGNELVELNGAVLPPTDIVIHCPNIDNREQRLRCVGGGRQCSVEKSDKRGVLSGLFGMARWRKDRCKFTDEV